MISLRLNSLTMQKSCGTNYSMAEAQHKELIEFW